jgi:hypothetical protein
MNHRAPNTYYRPYETDEDNLNDDDDLDDTDESDHDEDAVENIRAEKDPRYAIIRAAGPSLNTIEKQNKFSSSAPGAPFDVTTNIRSLADHVYLDPPKATKTSLVSIKSIHRDKRIYPTPYRFQLKLPRVYKDVTKFQLVQMSFPNNASNTDASTLFNSSFTQLLLDERVPARCSSVCISLANCVPASNAVAMVEQGRTNAQGEPLLVALSVPTGSYTDTQIAQHLSQQANSTPPLNIISYEDFKDIFMNTGDILCLFNEPGENYISRTTSRSFGVHTKENIMNSYYHMVNLEVLTEITEQIAFVAYYFPVLKEVIATSRARPFLQTGDTSYDGMVEAVMGPFLGFDYPLYEQLCRLNQDALDVYRQHLTFELRNINKYNWSYDSNSQRFTTVHDQLHMSLQREFSQQYQSTLNQELRLINLDQSFFNSMKTELSNHQSIYKHLERHLSTTIGNYYLMGGYTYKGGETHVCQGGSTMTACDLEADADFNAMFCYRSTFGRIFNNYAGTTFTFSTFTDYHSTLSSYYQTVQGLSSTISSVQGHVHQSYHDYISKKYGHVLPSTMLQHRTYLSKQGVPMTFITNQNVYIPGQRMNGLTPNTTLTPHSMKPPSNTVTPTYNFPENMDCSSICCTVLQSMINGWYSGIPVNTVINSMSYRMGILNMTPGVFNISTTVSQVTSTNNRNLLISINENQGFNNMDITMPENYSVSNETTGQVKLISGKILMEALGNSGVSQTVIQNPAVFENALGKLDKLDISIYYDDNVITPAWLYLPYFLSIQEWDATFQIDEQVGFANQGTGWGNRPSIPIPENPDSTPFIHFTHKNNPNNS